MLSDLHAARRRNEGGGGGNIEAVGVVAAGADDLEDVHAGVYLCGVVAHGGGAACNLVGRLGAGALGREGREERCVLGGGGLTAHDLVHHGVGFVITEIALVDDLHDGFFDHGFNSPSKSFPAWFCRSAS